jgi:hypothetical protein
MQFVDTTEGIMHPDDDRTREDLIKELSDEYWPLHATSMHIRKCVNSAYAQHGADLITAMENNRQSQMDGLDYKHAPEWTRGTWKNAARKLIGPNLCRSKPGWSYNPLSASDEVTQVVERIPNDACDLLDSMAGCPDEECRWFWLVWLARTLFGCGLIVGIVALVKWWFP